MHTSLDGSQQPVYGNPRSLMLEFNHDIGPGVMTGDFQVTVGPGSPNAGTNLQVLAVDVVRNRIFLRVPTELTLVASVEVIVGVGVTDEFGQSFSPPQAVMLYGVSVSNPSNGEFGSVDEGSAGRILAGGFESGEDVTIDIVDGATTERLGTLTGNENGIISGFFNIPFPAGGPYTMVASGDTGREVTATFDVVAP